MVTADGVKDKIRRLINTANATTGKTDVTLTTAVNSLVEGFGQGGDVNGLAYDMGEFVLDADTFKLHTADGIPHRLGETPDFIVIWTDDYADLTADNPSPHSTTTNLGYIWLHGLTGLPQRLNSVASSELGMLINMKIGASGYATSTDTPLSLSYTLADGFVPSENALGLHRTGNNCYWRAGVTYKYFVSKAWWNMGGVASAE